MALNLIIGPSGSGKTTKGYEIIINSSLENEKRNHFILVPEQFTMSTQKKIVDMHPRHGILNIDVLSFLRLSHRIFSETGDIDLPSLSEEGKNLIIRKVVGKISGKLNIYGKAVNQPGTISEIKSAISELLQYKISEEDLENAISSMSSTSRMYLKYKDILQIYIEYNQFIEGRYITSEGILDNLEQVVDRSSILQDSVVFLDSYTGFTPIQQRIICKLLKICKDVYVSVTLGTGENEYAPRTAFEVFALPKRTISNLQEIAIKNGVEINKIYPLKDKIEKKDLNSNKSQLSNDIDLDIDKNIILDKGNNIIPIRFESNLIFSHLEKNIFRLGVKEQIEDNDNRIVIHRSENPKEEALEVAASIRHAVRTRNLKYKDVGLVVAEMDAYGEYLEEAFKIYNIPVFMDYKRSVFLNVGVEFIRSLLNMLVENYSWESIFRFLRVTDIIPRNIVYQLENYCETVGINTYKKWLSPFKYKTKYMTDEDLDTLNKYRNLFVEYISDIDYIKKARSKTVSDIVNALYSFILKEDLQQKLQDLADKYEKGKNLRASKEYNQIYKMIMDLFDQMVGLIGDERIGISEFAKVFDAGLNSLKIGIVPPTTDQVVVGDLTRTRLDDIKALFIIGANDIYIPKIGGEGIISEKDKAFFKKANIELSESKGEKSFEEKFYLYLNLTKPKETIYISYSRRDNLGVSLFPSYLVPSILELYKDKKIIEKTAEEIEPVSQVVLSTYLKELRNALDKNEEFSPKIKMYSKILVDVGDIINKSLENHRISDLTSSVAKELYADRFRESISRAEKYNSCPFAEFMTYGLKIEEKKSFEIKAMDVGNICHTALEKYGKTLQEEGKSWEELSTEQQDELIDKVVRETTSEYQYDLLHSTFANEHRISQVKDLLKTTVWALTTQIEKGRFRPYKLEEKLEKGKIDRIDICEENDKVYVKVIDYKTGQNKFNLNKFYNGLSLQLPFYLSLAMDVVGRDFPGKKIIPAGMIYYHIDNPILKQSDVDGNASLKTLENLKPTGKLLADIDVIDNIAIEPNDLKFLANVTFKKDGDFSATSEVLDEEAFSGVLQYSEKKVNDTMGDIKKGITKVNPYAYGSSEKACIYCKYKSICKFDPRQSSYNRIPNLKDDNVIEKIKEDISEDELYYEK